MKTNQAVLLLAIFLFVGCNSIATSNSVQREPIETSASLSTAMPTLIPIYEDTSCEPSPNPYVEIPEMYSHEKPFLPNIPISRICTFEGEILRGQFYIHKIQENLLFCLIPGGVMPDIPDKGPEGWFIYISDNCDAPIAENFAVPVNPPFHMNTLLHVFGWRFRNDDNTEDSGSGYERYINFVFDREDYDTSYYSLACSMWSSDTDCMRATQTSINTDVTRTRGLFSIMKLELGNLVPNSHAWIESMEFKFAVYLADE